MSVITDRKQQSRIVLQHLHRRKMYSVHVTFPLFVLDLFSLLIIVS